jgi:purine catabolism regulator
MHVSFYVPGTGEPHAAGATAGQLSAFSPAALALSINLTQLALDGAGLEAVAKAIAHDLDAPVLIEDRQFNLLGHGAPPNVSSPTYDEIVTSSGTPVAILKELEDSGTLRQMRAEKGLLTIPSNENCKEPRHLCPIVVGGEIMGYLSCVDTDGKAGALAPEFLMAGVHAVAIELLKQKGIAENEQKLRRDFFRDLLFSNGNISPETLHRRATYLGYQLSSAYWALTVEFDQVPNEELLPDEVTKLASNLNSLLSFRQALVITQTQGATILYPIKEGQPTLDKIKHLAETIRQKVLAGSAGWGASIGVGQLYNDLLSIPRSYREAQHAVKIGRALNGPNTIACFAELGIYRMLLQFAQTQNPNEFFCEALQRLLEYDQQADKELVKTLTAFLECNGNLTETSDRLFIHRNTLKYRLERIRDITQIDLDDSENRLMLHLGLKMNQIVSTIKR